MEISEHILKISGKATLTEPLNLSTSFKLEVDGAVTDTTDSDNQDGSFSRTYRFKPTVISVIKNIITREWREDGATTLTAEEYYDQRMKGLIEMLINKKI